MTRNATKSNATNKTDDVTKCHKKYFKSTVIRL